MYTYIKCEAWFFKAQILRREYADIRLLEKCQFNLDRSEARVDPAQLCKFKAQQTTTRSPCGNYHSFHPQFQTMLFSARLLRPTSRHQLRTGLLKHLRNPSDFDTHQPSLSTALRRSRGHSSTAPSLVKSRGLEGGVWLINP